MSHVISLVIFCIILSILWFACILFIRWLCRWNNTSSATHNKANQPWSEHTIDWEGKRYYTASVECCRCGTRDRVVIWDSARKLLQCRGCKGLIDVS